MILILVPLFVLFYDGQYSNLFGGFIFIAFFLFAVQIFHLLPIDLFWKLKNVNLGHPVCNFDSTVAFLVYTHHCIQQSVWA